MRTLNFGWLDGSCTGLSIWDQLRKKISCLNTFSRHHCTQCTLFSLTLCAWAWPVDGLWPWPVVARKCLASASSTAHKLLTNLDLSAVQDRDLHCVCVAPLCLTLWGLDEKVGERETETKMWHTNTHADIWRQTPWLTAQVFSFSPL